MHDPLVWWWIAIVLLPLIGIVSADRIVGRAFATRSEVLARHAMVATSQPLATQAALEILQRGGSAVDGAIAANAALAVVEPTGCGLGGDLFALLWLPRESRLLGLNASGRSPLGLSRALLASRGLERLPTTGPLSVSVPGCVDGWFALHARGGELSLREVLAPAIRHAREGFPVSETIAAFWARGADLHHAAPGFRATFLPRGRAPAKGEIFRNEALARTLEVLADEGREAFYRGALAESIDRFCREAEALLRREDLEAHTHEWVDPLSTTWQGLEVHALPPNGQGQAVLEMLNLLEDYDLAAAGFGSADHVHLLVEAKKLAYEDLARWVADPSFADLPTAELVSKAYARRRRAALDPQRAATEIVPCDPRVLEGGTVYLAVGDPDGGLVSLIQSNYRGFGSGLAVPSLGFGLQNRGCAFALDPAHPNAYAPGKRPFHTITPGFVTEQGRPRLAYGVMGADMQPQGQVQVLLNRYLFGMNHQEAGDAPRAWHTGSSEPTGERMQNGGVLSLESGFSPATRFELARRGHRLGDARGHFGGYQAVARDEAQGVWIGASESRTDGQAAGC